MTTLDEISERASRATQGPWKLWCMQVVTDPAGNSEIDDAQLIAHTADPHRGLQTFNAEFIAHAREDIPKLIAALRAVEAVHTKNCFTSNAGGCRHGDNCDLSYCGSCSEDWPCPTIRAIREALDG